MPFSLREEWRSNNGALDRRKAPLLSILLFYALVPKEQEHKTRALLRNHSSRKADQQMRGGR